MPLTDTAIRTTKPADKPIKLFDERGLLLLVAPSGGKWWRFRYRFDGKHKSLSMGVYPDVSLAKARERRDEARKLLADGIDPSKNRKAQKAARADRNANSFEVVAREWFAKFKPNWVEAHSDKVIRRLERDVFPWIGGDPIAEVRAPDLLACLRRVESRGTVETAHRALQSCGQIFRYAIATGRASRDPSGDLRGALSTVKGTHLASITEPTAVGGLLRACDGYQGSLVTKCALRLAPLVFVRPGELRKAEWTEIDLERAEWNIPAERMKAAREHRVPLSPRMCDLLRVLPREGDYVFMGMKAGDHIGPLAMSRVSKRLRPDVDLQTR